MTDCSVLRSIAVSAIGFVVVAVLLGVAVFYLMGGGSAPACTEFNSAGECVAMGGGTTSTPTGQLFLTATPEGAVRPYPYIFDLATGTLTRGDRGDSQVTQYHRLSFNNRWVAFVGTSTISQSETTDDTVVGAPQVYVYPFDPAQPLQHVIVPVYRATDNIARDKRMLSVGEDGRVLYVGRQSGGAAERRVGEGGAASGSAANWTIYLAHRSGWDEAVTSGVSPQWIDVNQFVFVGDGGLYWYNIATGASGQLAAFPVGVDTPDTIHLAAAPDGERLVWTDPTSGAVVTAEILYDAGRTPLGLGDMASISVVASRAIFSADGSMIALQELAPDGTADRVSFYRADTLAPLNVTVRLHNLKRAAPVVTEWR